MKKTIFIILLFAMMIIPFYNVYSDQPVIGAQVSTVNPDHYNVSIAAAHTEYSQTLTNVQNLTFQCRSSFPIRYAFVTGKVAVATASYMTLKRQDVFSQYDIDISSTTIYFAATQSGVVVEIEKW